MYASANLAVPVVEDQKIYQEVTEQTGNSLEYS